MVVREGGLQVTPVCGGAPGEREKEGGGRVKGRKKRREGGKGGCGRDGGKKGRKR